jgi:DNA-binding IclR family transcriptional regulator
MRQRERSAAIQQVLADGDWHSTGDIAHQINGPLSTVHRSMVGLVSAGVLDVEKRHPASYYRLKDHT